MKAFNTEGAAKRLAQYEREERAACEPWLTVARVLTSGLGITFLVGMYVRPEIGSLAALAGLPLWVVQDQLQRRLRRRVKAKAEAELRDGRFWKCLDCDYDLRASETRCPECGASVRAGPL